MEILLLLRQTQLIKKTSRPMRAVFLFTIFLGLAWQPVFSQTTYPTIPEADYVVYTTILDDWSKCDDKKYAYQHNKLLFIKHTTKKADNHFFRFNYIRIEENLISSLHNPQATFYKETAWKIFIASVDINQFSQYEIQKPLQLKCQKTATWSPEIEDYYFGKETVRFRDYYALRKDYVDFGGIISFSKVVYSANQQKALCYYSKVSDGKAGAGNIVFLEKTESIWKVVGYAELWGA